MNRLKATSAARQLAAEIGLANMTRHVLCERLGIPDGSFVKRVGCSFSELLDDLYAAGVPVGEPDGRKRQRSEIRKDLILAEGLELAKIHGYQAVTRRMVAEAAGVADSLISAHFSGMGQFRTELMRRAIRDEVLQVVAQGLAVNDPVAAEAPRELRAVAVELLK